MTTADTEGLLLGLNEAQQTAVQHTRGPLVILAGAGTGKTRVISRRAAYAIATGAVPTDRVLLVTFTEKAATEMAGRMADLGFPAVMARTFHAAALAQLRHFWPGRHQGEPLPTVLRSKMTLIAPLVARLPGHYTFTPARDVADAIEWAKVRRITPDRWSVEGGERAPLPPDLFARLFRNYERAKERVGALDFEDMLIETVRLLEEDRAAAELIRSRKTWVSVDEYQDTNPLAERLLELWLGRSTDLAVVGDPDQTIYTFAGATPDYLLNFANRHPGSTTVALTQNYRSTPQILALANRLLSATPRGALVATRPDGARPLIQRHSDAEQESAAIVADMRRLQRGGVALADMAVLTRTNAQIAALEEILAEARIPFRGSGTRFYDRPDVRRARQLVTRARLTETGQDLLAAVRTLFETRIGFGEERSGEGNEARERDASLELLLTTLRRLVDAEADAGVRAFLAELDRLEAAERSGTGDGISLLTYHRAKGLEWAAVFLPALEEGSLPIRQAKDDVAIDEERRLLYVGMTRARDHLNLSWAQTRPGQGGNVANRKMSRFLIALEPRQAVLPSPARAAAGPRIREGHLLERLRLWRRERAQADAVPAYVVAHDTMLEDIAEQRPQSAAALRRVKGMGPARLERYAEEILAVVATAGPSS